MRTLLVWLFLLAGLCGFAQERCGSTEYQLAQKAINSPAGTELHSAEIFLQKSSSVSSASSQAGTEGNEVITIPVVVHVLYNNLKTSPKRKSRVPLKHLTVISGAGTATR